MNSVFNRLLIALQEKVIADIPDSIDTPGIRYVEQDLGQLDVYEIRPSVSFPCLMVDFAETQYQQKQLKSQWGVMNIQFRLGFDQFGNSSNLAPEDARIKALAYYEIENKLYLSLHDWKADGLLMLPLQRVSAATEKREDKFRVRNIVFKATYEDRGLQALQQ